jgi:hypothetical protein
MGQGLNLGGTTSVTLTAGSLGQHPEAAEYRWSAGGSGRPRVRA